MGNLLVKCLNSLHQSANETHKKVIENFGYDVHDEEIIKFVIGYMLSTCKMNIYRVISKHSEDCGYDKDLFKVF